MNKKWISLLLIAALAVPSALLSGCSKKETAPEAVQTEVKAKASLIYGLWSAPSGMFNPTVSNTTYDDAINAAIYNGMLKMDDKMALQPDLAESYTVSEDNQEITFKLRQDVKWHDGQPFTAKDVVFTYKSLADANYKGSQYGLVEMLKGATAYHEGKSKEFPGIQLVDDYTVKFSFEKTYAPALINLGTFSIIPEHVWAPVNIGEWDKATAQLSSPIGTGAFKMNAFKTGESVTLDRNDAFYGDVAKTKTLIFKVINQDNVQVELQNGTVDIAEVSDLKKRDLDSLTASGLSLQSFPNRLFQYMGFNLRQERFQNKQLRQAFMYALDRQVMVDKILEGNGQVINTAMIPSGWAYPEASTLNAYAFNVDTAKSLLKEAGYEDKNADGVVENAKGEKLAATLYFPTGNKTRELIAPIIQSQLKAIGVEIKLESMEFDTMMEKVVGNHEYDLYLMGNNLGADPDPKPYWHTTSASDEKGMFAWNISSFKNAKADSLMEAGLATLDMAKRKQIYNEFGVLMNDEVPWNYLFSQNVVFASSAKCKNYKPSTYGYFTDIEQWYVEE